MIKYFSLISLFFLVSCSTSGPVDTDLNDSVDLPVVDSPQGFHSDLDELIKIQNELSRIGNGSSARYQSFIQREDELISEMESAQESLFQGGINLIGGQSYSFRVQSFCVHPGAYRPLAGDGFRVGPLTGKASSWLPEILEKLPRLRIEQGKVQSLIWTLLSGVHFDDLSDQDQYTLSLFFDDGLKRFGSSAANQIGSTILDSVLPDAVKNKIEDFSDFRDQIYKYRGDFKKLEAALAPRSNRLKPIPVGWIQMKEGYLLKVTANGYTETRVDIYVPEEKGNRKSQSKALFKLSQLIALPEVGQRLALSHKLNIPSRTNNDAFCKKLQNYKPKKCVVMEDSIRERILSLANPKNFSKTKYSSPPDWKKTIESETDCSRFTQQIYERAGMEYPYSSTSTFQCLSVFKEEPISKGKPGDLVLYKGHIGILSKSGSVISATVGGAAKRSKLDPNDPNFLPSITELPIDQAGSGVPKIMNWSCP